MDKCDSSIQMKTAWTAHTDFACVARHFLHFSGRALDEARFTFSPLSDSAIYESDKAKGKAILGVIGV